MTAPVHDRMPVILNPQCYEPRLDLETTDTRQAPLVFRRRATGSATYPPLATGELTSETIRLQCLFSHGQSDS